MRTKSISSSIWFADNLNPIGSNYNCIKKEYDRDCIQYNERLNEYILHDNNYIYILNPPMFGDKIYSHYGSRYELRIQLKNLSN